MNENIQKLKEWVQESDNIVFFGGAGVSTESGIPDFRSVDGLYNQKWDYPPETILSHSFFNRYPDEYYRFHREKLVIEGVQPNRAHIRLAELEEEGKLRAVITQNIDGLHQAAGSKNVLELHGSILRAYCSRCGRKYPADMMNYGTDVPSTGQLIASAHSTEEIRKSIGADSLMYLQTKYNMQSARKDSAIASVLQ